MLKSRKHVFWEALIITITIFIMGLFLGMLIETGNSEKVSQFYLQSEINLVDGLAITLLSENFEFDCDTISQQNIDFANRVYEEAVILEEYEASGTLTESMAFLHKKYDLLRTLLWMSNQDSLERCDNYDLIVYLYDYNSEEIRIKAQQNVWSKILLEIKRENDNLLLLPIAADQNITSLNLLMEEYEIKSLPAVIINNDKVIYTLEDVDELRTLIG